MIYIIHGDNIEKRKQASLAIGAAHKFINSDNLYAINDLLSNIESQSLWGDSQIIILDKILEDKETKEAIYENIEALKNSDNKFVIEEIKINAATLTKISKHATKVYDCTIGELVNNKGNNRVPEKSPFKLCDYIAARDKKNAWIELMRLYETDIESEPLHGAIWWKLKMENAVSGPSSISSPQGRSTAQNAKASSPSLVGRVGEGPRVFDFIMISLRAHNGECNFRNEIERWVLSL